MRIAILGGTGKEGGGLALRWARSEEIVIGSRQQEKAERVSGELNAKLGADLIRGALNPAAAGEADLAVLTVPYESHIPTLSTVKDALQGKVLIDTTVPLDPGKPTRLRPGELSAAEEAQEFLGPGVRVAAAFETVSFTILNDLAQEVHGDVLVCSDHKDAMEQALRLVRLCGFRAIDAGALRNARVVEAMTPMLIHINKKYRVKHAGFRVSGLEGAAGV
ncbi:MAG: NADPH-dependent F420 reductase [Nitrospinota bacterium]